MSGDVGPIRTPKAPTTYELNAPSSGSIVGIAATCPHCDWTAVKPYPRGVRYGTDSATALAEDLNRECAEHKRDHLAAYVTGALHTAVGPLGTVETAVRRLGDYGLVIIADPDWTPEAKAEKPVDSTDDAA